MKGSALLLDPKTRKRLWAKLVAALEAHLEGVKDLPVTPPLDPTAYRRALERFDFHAAVPAEEAFDFAVEGLRTGQVQVCHPRYYGLFNPAPATASIAGDALVAAFNPQLAAWSHSPFAIETERHLVRLFADRFGYSRDHAEGTFCSGGAEANHTAVLAALTRSYPEFPRLGVRSLRSQPVLYVSAEGHDSVRKAARLCGLGTDAVRLIGVTDRLQVSPQVLEAQIHADREQGFAPFLVVATAGSTACGAIDPLREIGRLTSEENLWLHVDAAWGGAAVLAPELRGLLEGIERADSITFDAHKFLSVPMGAGLFLTRHPGILERTFRVSAGYMPKEARALEVSDPWADTIQWSRRFIGLKVFLALAVAGWDGYRETILNQSAMGDRLRLGLAEAGWRVVNDTPLPLVCFVDDTRAGGADPDFLDAVAMEIGRTGKAWISTVNLGPVGPALRACITNYRTGPEDIDALVADLDAARVRSGPMARSSQPGRLDSGAG